MSNNIEYHFQVHWDTATQSWTVDEDTQNISSDGPIWDVGSGEWREAQTDDEIKTDKSLFVWLTETLTKKGD